MAPHYPHEFTSGEEQDPHLNDLQDELCTISQRIQKIERCHFNPCVLIIIGFGENLECYNSIDNNNDHWKLHVYKLFNFINISPFYILNMWKDYDSANTVIQLMSHNVKMYVHKILSDFFKQASPDLITTLLKH